MTLFCVKQGNRRRLHARYMYIRDPSGVFSISSLELNAGYRFVTEEPGARGRRRLEIDEESLSVLHSIYYAWSAVACETGVSSIPNDFTEAAGVESTDCQQCWSK